MIIYYSDRCTKKPLIDCIDKKHYCLDYSTPKVRLVYLTGL